MNIDIVVEPVVHVGDRFWVITAIWNVIEILSGFFGSGGVDDSRDARIVARRSDGARRNLFGCTALEADEKRARVERELATMPVEAWCSRYRVPEAFANRAVRQKI